MMSSNVIYTGLIKTEIGNWNSDGYFYRARAICKKSWWKVPEKSGWASDNKKWYENLIVSFVVFFAPHTCNRLNALSWLWGAKKRQMMLLNFLIVFYYLMLNQIFPGLSTKIFRILHKLDVNNHLNSSCRSQSWSGLYISHSSIS